MSHVDIAAHNSLPLSSLGPLLPPELPPRLQLYTSSAIPAKILDSCFMLVATNMKAMYKRSSMGWSATDKKREMKHPSMRFLVLFAEKEEEGVGARAKEEEWVDDDEGEDSGLGGVIGFASFMVTEEEGEGVIYWLVRLRSLSSHPLTQGWLVWAATNCSLPRPRAALVVENS
jgi:hypothetical protein